MPVYNLTVDAPVGEYFANGVLVHNCDTLRYAVAYLDQPGNIVQAVSVPGFGVAGGTRPRPEPPHLRHRRR